MLEGEDEAAGVDFRGAVVISNDKVKGWPREPWLRQEGTYPPWATLPAVTYPQRRLAINSANTALSTCQVPDEEL